MPAKQNNMAEMPAGESSGLKYHVPTSINNVCINSDGCVSAAFAQWRFRADGLFGCKPSVQNYHHIVFTPFIAPNRDYRTIFQ